MDRTPPHPSQDAEDPLLEDEEDEDEDEEDEGDEEFKEMQAGDVGVLMRFLRPAMRHYRWLLLLMSGVLVIETVFAFSFPVVTQQLVDKGLIGETKEDEPQEQHKKDFRVVVGSLIFLGAAAVIVSVLGVYCEYLGARIFTGMIKDIRERLFAHLQALSMRYYSRTRSGTILARFSGDLVALEGALAPIVSCLALPAMEVVFAAVLMFYFNWKLALIGAIIFPLIFIGPKWFAARAFALSYDKRQSEGRILSAVQENVAAQPVVKAYGLDRQQQAAFAQRNVSWLPVGFRVNFFAALVERSAYTSLYLVHLLVFGLGAYWVYEEQITLGTFIAFEGMFFEMGAALTYISQFLPTLAHAAGSVRHIDDLFNEKPDIVDAPNAVTAPRLSKEIVFDNVFFRYEEDGFEVKKLNVRIRHGSHIAFVGPSGSGKSTLLNLLLRFYDPTRGAILLDGVDLRRVTQASLRAQIGIVFQDSFLFNTNIMENIRLGKPDATREEVVAAARAAEIHEFIMSLPDGYDTLVGERGSQLSGGQRQRIAIARALVRDPAILILDEATSALDYATEAALLATLRKIAQGRSVINVTHRLSSVVDADHIVLMDRGRIREEGTHEELLRRGGRYGGLWRKQYRKPRAAAHVGAED